jgi:hypothetical protein
MGFDGGEDKGCGRCEDADANHSDDDDDVHTDGDGLGYSGPIPTTSSAFTLSISSAG